MTARRTGPPLHLDSPARLPTHIRGRARDAVCTVSQPQAHRDTSMGASGETPCKSSFAGHRGTTMSLAMPMPASSSFSAFTSCFRHAAHMPSTYANDLTQCQFATPHRRTAIFSTTHLARHDPTSNPNRTDSSARDAQDQVESTSSRSSRRQPIPRTTGSLCSFPVRKSASQSKWLSHGRTQRSFCGR